MREQIQPSEKLDAKQFFKLNSDLRAISNNELILRMEKLVRTERKITHLVLLHIAEIEDRKIYAEMGYDGMYSYLTRGLGYSEGSAYRRLQSARLLKQVPSVAEKIENGSLNLTQLTQVQKCIKEASKNEQSNSSFNHGDGAERTLNILSKLENKNSFETQKTLAMEMNIPVQSHEKIKPQADDSIRIEMTLSAEQFQELEKAKNLLSHICPDGSWAEVIATLAKDFNRRKLEGRSKSKQAITSDKKNDKMIQSAIAARLQIEKRNALAPTKRKYISVHKKRALLNRANNCCEYIDSKSQKRCSSKFLLEVDHIHPIALGGTDEVKNLRILCRTHNILAARKLGLSLK